MKNDRQPPPGQLSSGVRISRTKAKALCALLALMIFCSLVFLVLRLAASPASLRLTPQGKSGRPPVASPALLPGQQRWKDGVSSFLFGTNDTQEWVANNIETDASMQQALQDAHFTLLRTFFFDRSLLDGHPTTDAEIDQRLRTVENSHMTCLGVLEPVDDPSFIERVVSHAGSRCNLYEFGNEPDTQSMSDYVLAWNSQVPKLRRLNPSAKFIGPVAADYTRIRPFLSAVKASGVLPDAVSFHWYPCGPGDSSASCLAKASTFAEVTQQVKAWVRSTLGANLPVGISEWNYNADNPPTAYGNDPAFITRFTTSALRAMIGADLDFANQFDAASGAGQGGLDMIDTHTGTPKAQYMALKNLSARYWPGGSS